MHVLWLIPAYYSFLKEELEAIAPLVGQCSVMSQAPAEKIRGVTCVSIPADFYHPTRIVRRGASLLATVAQSPIPRSLDDLRSLRRLARFNEHLRAYVRHEGVDVIHSHFAVPEGTAGWQAAGGRPVILTLRGVDILTIPSIGYGFSLDSGYRRRLRAALQRVEAVTVASSETLSAAVRAGAEPANVHVIPNGVDIERFQRSATAEAAFRANFGLANQTIIAGVGNLTPRKSFDVLIRAFAEVSISVPELTLVIAGEGPDRPRLEDIVARLMLGNRVRFVGAVSRDEIPGLYSAASVFVHAPLAEGFGNVVLEAMASGCAVIVTPTGAGRDVVVDNVNGMVVGPGDVGHLAHALALLLSQPDRRAHLVAEGVRVRDSLSLTARATAFVDVYARVHTKRRDRSPSRTIL